MNDLSRSDSFYYKKCLEKLGIIPMQKDISERLGDSLTKVFFESCIPALKTYLGLTPPLDGPPTDLWVSPSDLLIGKVALKAPFTNKHIKALTHEGILEIGEVVEEKVRKEHLAEIEKAVNENTIMMKYLAERERIAAVKKAREEEKRRYEEIIEDLKEEFSETLKEELARLQEKLKEEERLAVELAKEEKEKEMKKKMELAIMETVQRLTEKFAQELIKQSKCLHKHFWYHIKEEKRKLKESMREERAQCRENMEKLRTELQCENIANIMYMLARERRRCDCEKQMLTNNFEASLQELRKELEERGEKLQSKVNELEQAGLAIIARETAMFEIIKQFQKFIYFVLRSVPTQAEYLLSVEKLMIFELTKSMIITKPDIFKLKGETGEGSIDVKSKSSSSGRFTEKTSESKEREFCSADGIVANDCHECDNKIRYIESAHTLEEEEEDLPTFTYGEKLYVREDFRNMLSQGLRISESNEFWNFGTDDVMNLIEPVGPESELVQPPVNLSTFKELIGTETEPKVNLTGRVSFQTEKLIQSTRYGSKNQFVEEIFGEEEEEQTIAVVDKDRSREGSTDSLKRRRQSSRLEMARDSLTLLKERKLSSQILRVKSKSRELEIPKVKKNGPCGEVDKSFDTTFLKTRKIISKTLDSKLDLHVDSFILMKSKEAFKSSLREPIKFCNEKFTSTGIQCEVPKAVEISHIEIIPQENKKRGSSVMFYSRPNIIPSPTESTSLQENKSGEEVYEESDKTFSDVVSTGRANSREDFSAKRVNSVLRIFKEDPSLRRMFTEVSKN